MKPEIKATIKIKIQRDYFVFSAAHFAIMSDDITEPLHGHNYHVSLVVEGAVGNYGYIIQFADLKSAARKVVSKLNHRVLIPKMCNAINIKHDADSIIVKTKAGKIYMFPVSDVVLLPIINTTVESLSEYVAEEIFNTLPRSIAHAIKSLQVGIDESVGQGAIALMEF